MDKKETSRAKQLAEASEQVRIKSEKLLQKWRGDKNDDR